MNGILLRLRRPVRATARTGADRGASAVEYGLMIAAIAAVIVGTVFALGGLVGSTFDKTCDALNKPTGGACVKTP